MKVGDVFVVPLRVGGFGAAIVIDALDSFTVLVADEFWASPPSAADVAEFHEMPLLFGQTPLPGAPDVLKGWFDGEVPADFEVLLNRPLSARQKSMRGAEGTMVFQSARDFARTLSDHWHWTNDRAAYMADLDRRVARFEKAEAQRREGLSLESMLREAFFADWADRWPAEHLTEARRIFTDATVKLIALREGGTARKRSLVFRKIVEAFNGLYNATGLVESVERDQIVERIDELAALVGLDNANEKLTRRRTW